MESSVEQAARFTQRAAELRKIIAETKDKKTREILTRVAEDYDRVIRYLMAASEPSSEPSEP